MNRRSHRVRHKPTFKLEQLPIRQLRNPYAPIRVMSEESIELIHDGSMKILERIGLQIVNDQARALMLAHGATTDDKTCYLKMERDMVMEKISTIPATFTLHARNSQCNSVYGDNHINFAPVSSAPNCSDLDSGRRTRNFEDFCKFLKLGQTFNVIGLYSGYPVEPVDLPAHNRHLDAYRAFITLTEKPWHAYSLGNGKIEDAIEMICMACAIDKEILKKEPSIMTVVNTNSPECRSPWGAGNYSDGESGCAGNVWRFYF